MPKQPDYAQLRALAASPEGQKLIQLLKNADSSKLNAVISAASAGEYAKAKESLCAILSDQEAETLIQNLEKKL